MDLRQIKNLMKEFEDSKIHKLEINDHEFSIKLEKETITFSGTPSISATSVAATGVAATEVVEKQEEVIENLNILVKAPLVGTFYESPSPDANAFVRVGQKINKGDTLFIVEAMKVLNEITAPVDGVIAKINISDATMVEYGQVVMEIKE
ncbi:Biotin carboxyl carrier protein of acetyl-CoA carboxylase [Candidatus Izimaplasma bacterium HR1]|uniref:acetyl-CoA carboxylase biotin carboxyl carrier protein n=1 Tax=Candidatus Izimoplasma sp. HR1 TaxID=1541959 RepID=UPI0004F816CB|nr:Biotin carboxyl carrier protein of acetyl-CoA carboxylase [Candidatus Izimaplasma bacterium HR1]